MNLKLQRRQQTLWIILNQICDPLSVFDRYAGHEPLSAELLKTVHIVVLRDLVQIEGHIFLIDHFIIFQELNGRLIRACNFKLDLHTRTPVINRR